MGNRCYGLGQDTSDADLAIAVPESLLQREREIQMLLGFRLVGEGVTLPKADAPVHQISNQPLKWTDMILVALK